MILVRLRSAISTILVVAATSATASANPFDGRGMWIWYVSRTEGGDVSAIAAQARSAGIKTLYIKSGDGSGYWSQFNRSLVRGLHAGGVNVCAWQYVYGSNPSDEAAVGARAVSNGADCLVIDAEVEYEGRYASAQTYIDALRSAVGRRYPIGLATFPYVDYHPSFPYSVFLGHGGAQYNLPQMYWRDIGTSVDAVYAHTYANNRIYRRFIRPLGQTDNGAGDSEISLFRGLSVRYHAGGLSWWNYAWTAAGGLWSAISGPFTSVSSVATLGFPLLGVGSTGDQVLWMQELLAGAIPSQRTTGTFASETLAHLQSFQARHGIPVTGQTGPLTWQALLRQRPVQVVWAARDVGRAGDVARARGAGAGRARGARAGVRVAPAPESATLPTVRYEIRGSRARAR
jgi:peptidoglycan hydrolase-like protein with peptidoglycan-binding domain